MDIKLKSILPFALPRTRWNDVERRIHAVDMEGYVAFITENKIGFVVFETAAFAYGTI